MHQVVAAPQLRVDVDRTRAAQIGLTQHDVANNLLVSLGSSSQRRRTSGSTRKRRPYRVAVQTPQYRIDTIDALMSTPMSWRRGRGPRSCSSNLAAASSAARTPAVVNHYNVQPVFDVYANVQGRDLGGVARRRADGSWTQLEPELPAGSYIAMRGQVESMNAAFVGLGRRPGLRRRCWSTS